MNTSISNALATAKAAHLAGHLSSYKPLVASGKDARKSTANASWGPAMRR